MASSELWQYPVRIGDGKDRVHNALGLPDGDDSFAAQYPMHGLTVFFDANDTVKELAFAGYAGVVKDPRLAGDERCSASSFEQVPAAVEIVFGLTAREHLLTFKRVLGNPARYAELGKKPDRVFRYIWKKGGYVVDAQFLRDDCTVEGTTFKGGTLVSFVITRGI